MAKRGYRGKHPYNDAKVEQASSTKYSSKLTTEYNKLKDDKQKYDYIRTHYYYPQSTCTLKYHPTNTGDASGENISITSTDGTTLVYTAATSEDLAAREFRILDSSGSLANCINAGAGHNGKISAVASANQVVLTQAEPGPDGNTSISGSTHMSASGQVGIVSTNGKFFYKDIPS